jgi:hypothetical protein
MNHAHHLTKRLGAALLVTVAVGLAACGDDEPDGMRVLAADESVGDSSPTDLVAAYARNISVTPTSASMLVDPSLCDMGLSTDDVYFAPTFGSPGESSASCTMKADQALFLSPAAVLCIESGADLADTACLDEQWNLTSSSVTIDGESVDLTDRRVDTTAQAITLPDDNIYGEPAMDTKLITRGQSVVVENLPVGAHEVVLAADFGNGEFAGSITIALTVEE